jgi:acyl-CoA thioester hydrolase
MSIPYSLPEIDSAAPFDRHRAVVLPGWIDGNGHMNVGYYLIAFDQATDTFFDHLGIGWDYVAHGLGAIFALEAHLSFVRELHAGDPLRVTTQILDYDEKRLHLFHALYQGEAGWLAATNELMLMHIDPGTRRGAPWRREILGRIAILAQAHAGLPRPDHAGRIIGIPRKGPT